MMKLMERNGAKQNSVLKVFIPLHFSCLCGPWEHVKLEGVTEGVRGRGRERESGKGKE